MSWPTGPTAPGPTAPQQQSYVPNAKPQAAVTQHGNSPQYRTAYPQLSPQMSPRQATQMSPHPQMSPRPLMSPAKPPTSSQPPQPQVGVPNQSSISSPRPTMTKGQQQQQQQVPPGSAPVNTLQALEQLVGPTNPNTGMPTGVLEYSQQTGAYRPSGVPSHVQMPVNPMSPGMGPRMPMSPQHQPWRQTPQQGGSSLNGSSHLGMPPHSAQMTQMPTQQNPNPLPPVSEMMAAQSQALPPISTVGSQMQSTNYNMEPLKQIGMSMAGMSGASDPMMQPGSGPIMSSITMTSQPQQMPPIVIPPPQQLVTLTPASIISAHQQTPLLQPQQQQHSVPTPIVSNNSKSTDSSSNKNQMSSMDSQIQQQIEQPSLQVVSEPASDNTSLLDPFMSSSGDEQQPSLSSINTSTPINEQLTMGGDDLAKDSTQADLESISNSNNDGSSSTGNQSASENQLQLTAV